ncbi:MAG TPA: hypothetical protein PKV76_00385, partial [Chitinophagales bacterium]|nr:hypothetical protein [Chitinophagales bacterium]
MKKLFFIIACLLIHISAVFAQEIKIMAWNIFMVPPMIFKSCQTERAFLIADYVRSINPDVLVLEET